MQIPPPSKRLYLQVLDIENLRLIGRSLDFASNLIPTLLLVMLSSCTTGSLVGGHNSGVRWNVEAILFVPGATVAELFAILETFAGVGLLR
jgi:maleate cis-trans isomerase